LGLFWLGKATELQRSITKSLAEKSTEPLNLVIGMRRFDLPTFPILSGRDTK